MDEKLKNWLAIMRAPHFGVRRLLYIHRRLHHLASDDSDNPLIDGDLADTVLHLLHSPQASLLSLGLRKESVGYLTHPDWGAVDVDLAWGVHVGQCIVPWYDPGYPPLLRCIADAPWCLYVRGGARILLNQQMAVVGSRNPSKQGCETAYLFAQQLMESGLTITSGMALGIDGAAHRGVIAHEGATIAVMGAGLNTIYPPQHRDLAEQILQYDGVLVSEYSPPTPVMALNFPKRNRIISGLSLGVVVVEAGLKSGSLITARCALEQGREVFAVPGSIHHPLAVGCNRLIKQGALLTDGVDAILENVGMLAVRHNQLKLDYNQSHGGSSNDKRYEQIINCFGVGCHSVDTIIVRSGLTPNKVCAMLSEMEVNGHIQAVSGGYVRV